MKIDEEAVIEIEDKILTCNRMKGSRWHSRKVNFEIPDTAQEGYLTGDEFERRCIANISKFYNERGLL